MTDTIDPPPWQEPPIFNLPCVPKSLIPSLPSAIPVLVHGVDGLTIPQLPDPLPAHSARPIEFRYEPSKVMGEHATDESVSKVASDLLKFLVTNIENKTSIATPPANYSSIMYFAYDFGGLVVKQALLIAAAEEQYRSIFSQTSLVVFYGTPHQSSSSQTWAANALRSLHFCFEGLLNSWVPSFIENGSNYYHHLNEKFKELAPEFCVLNICQQNKSSNYDLITDPTCAFTGVEREEQLILKRSHYQLGHILGAKEQEYMEDKMLDAAIYHWQTYRQFIDILHLQCHKLPRPPRADISPSQVKTFELFLSHPVARVWRNTSSTTKTRLVLGDDTSFERFLCLFSNHIIMAEGKRRNIVVGLGRDDPSGPPLTLCQLYASLCLQLLDQQPSLLLWARHLYPNLRDAILGLHDQWKVRSLARCLRTLLLIPKRGATYCLIHYDTTDESRLRIINDILSVVEVSEIPFHLLILTPPKAEMESTILTDCLHVDLSISMPMGDELTSCTNSSFIGHRTQSWAKFIPKVPLNPASGPSIPTTWNLNLALPEQILSACISNGMVWVLRIVAWISRAIRPLSRAQVEQALEAIYTRDVSIPADMRDGKVLFRTLELSLSRHLSVSEDAVEASLQLKQGIGSIWPASFDEGITPEIYIARTCLAITANFLKRQHPAATQISELEFLGATTSNSAHRSPISTYEPQNAHSNHQSPGNAIEEYASRYWMEHQFRASSGVNDADESFRQTLTTQRLFDQARWIRYLISSNWSSSIAAESVSKFLPESLQRSLGLSHFLASYISFRIAALPLEAEDDLDWVFLEIASKLLPGDEYFEVVLKIVGTPPNACRIPTLQRVIASSPQNLRARFLADLDVGNYLRDYYNELLLTSIAIGNTDAVLELLPKVSTLSAKYKGEAMGARRLGTALQVACEYGDEHFAARILNFRGAGAPSDLEESYPWSALHVACHQGHSSLVGKLLKDGNYKLLDQNTSLQFNLLLVASAHGLFNIMKSLKPLGIEVPTGNENALSAFQLACKYGFPNTLQTLIANYGYKITERDYKNNAMSLAIRSGNLSVVDCIMSGFADTLGDNDALGDAPTAVEEILRNVVLTSAECYQPHFDLWYFVIVESLGEVRDSQGRTPLMISAMMGSLDLVKKLFHGGGDFFDYSKRTAMHYACMNGHLDVVELLALDKSFELAAEDIDSNTPITAAARGGYQKIVELLLPRVSDEDRKAEFIRAARYGLERILSLILEYSADRKPKVCETYVNAKDDHFNTPLHYAAQYNHARVVQVLLSRRANLEAISKFGITPLAIAANCFSRESMQLLLDAGASPETPIKRKRSILTDAILFEKESSTKLLLDYGALPRLPDYWAHCGSLLELTLTYSTLGILKILLTYFNEARKLAAGGPLQHGIPTPTEASRDIIKHGDVDTFEVLLQVWDETEFDTTIFEEGLPIGPLFNYTARYGSTSMLRLLLDRSKATEERLELDEEPSKCVVEVNEVKGYYGTALQAAISSQTCGLEKVEMLINWGAEACPLHGRDTGSFVSQGEENTAALSGCWGTALHAAVVSNNMDILRVILKQDGVSKDQCDMMGRLPLHVAVLFSSWEMVKEVLSPISTITSEDRQGRNALHMACGIGNMDMVIEILRELGKSKDQIDKRDADGWTALHWACRSKRANLVNLLIDSGADIQAKAIRPQGWLPYHVATYYGWELDRLKPSNSSTESLIAIKPEAYTHKSCNSCHCLEVDIAESECELSIAQRYSPYTPQDPRCLS
ncbi:hypothetical protein O1611_g2638 [Lasiodiplodia mahajangana]|uniref:Uncharacterized protein n=1 Tax=Lasiodiplodia mahajangana TaxID=1108764 RepID=A0ACC2JTY1_9PEZI|nr:hypothetical protein O1611_g2638 [Lasiodiplodia mahajangana]